MRAGKKHSARRGLLLVLCLQILCWACKKESVSKAPEPLPDLAVARGCADDYSHVSGFIYSYLLGSPAHNLAKWKMNAFAIFSDPPANLCSSINPNTNYPTVWIREGNLNSGNVDINGFPLGWAATGHYSCSPNTPHPPDTAITWHVQGAGSFPGFTEHFDAPYPQPKEGRPTAIWISKANAYKVEVGNYFTDYDSVWLSVRSLQLARTKPGVTYAQLNAKEVEYYYPNGYDSVDVTLQAFRYYHSRRSGKDFQFLFVTNLFMRALITNY